MMEKVFQGREKRSLVRRSFQAVSTQPNKNILYYLKKTKTVGSTNCFSGLKEVKMQKLTNEYPKHSIRNKRFCIFKHANPKDFSYIHNYIFNIYIFSKLKIFTQVLDQYKYEIFVVD